jgi:hypothetical protein
VTLSLGGLAAVLDRIDDDGVVLAWSYTVDVGMFLMFLLSVGDRYNQKVHCSRYQKVAMVALSFTILIVARSSVFLAVLL